MAVPPYCELWQVPSVFPCVSEFIIYLEIKCSCLTQKQMACQESPQIHLNKAKVLCVFFILFITEFCVLPGPFIQSSTLALETPDSSLHRTKKYQPRLLISSIYMSAIKCVQQITQNKCTVS
jgi:hypothetical protein